MCLMTGGGLCLAGAVDLGVATDSFAWECLGVVGAGGEIGGF